MLAILFSYHSISSYLRVPVYKFYFYGVCTLITSSPDACNLFLTLIPALIPLVFQGLDSCLALRLDDFFSLWFVC